MRLRKRVVAVVLAVFVAGTLTACDSQDKSRSVQFATPGVSEMIPGCLCLLPLKSSDCAEDTIGWIGSSEDDRYKA